MFHSFFLNARGWPTLKIRSYFFMIKLLGRVSSKFGFFFPQTKKEKGWTFSLEAHSLLFFFFFQIV